MEYFNKWTLKHHTNKFPSICSKTHLTQVTGFLWPTKSMSVAQLSLSTICAAGPPLFMAWAETRYCPSGDQEGLSTLVVPPHWIKTLVFI